jgi:hypothetical protein
MLDVIKSGLLCFALFIWHDYLNVDFPEETSQRIEKQHRNGRAPKPRAHVFYFVLPCDAVFSDGGKVNTLAV